jgi:chloramphenicol-sensitive protein RarD
MADEATTRRGLILGVGAYGLWGLIPLYFKAVEMSGQVPPMEVLANRVLWCLAFLAVVVTLMARWRDAWAALCNRQALLILTASTTLIGINWFTYIYAVSTEQVMQSSLGYFITPLVNVLLGVVFLHERLRGYQVVGITLAAVGVLNLAITGGEFPWIALVLAASFSVYGLLRKTVAVDGLMGLLVETILLAPLAFGYLLYGHQQGQSSVTDGSTMTITLLMLSGPITAVPLLLFAGAARRLQLSTLGILQYLAPTVQFLLAVLVFGEPFTRSKLLSFACIWSAVLIYSFNSVRVYRRERQVAVLAAVQLATTELTEPAAAEGCSA